jgi:hypothetical protein
MSDLESITSMVIGAKIKTINVDPSSAVIIELDSDVRLHIAKNDIGMYVNIVPKYAARCEDIPPKDEDGRVQKRLYIPDAKLPALIRKVFELSSPQGMGYLHHDANHTLSDEEVAHIIDCGGRPGIHMDYIKGRSCKFHLFLNKETGEYYSLDIREGFWYDHSPAQLAELVKVLQ